MERHQEALEAASDLVVKNSCSFTAIALSVRTHRMLELAQEPASIALAGLLLDVAESGEVSLDTFQRDPFNPDVMSVIAGCCIFMKVQDKDFPEEVKFPNEHLMRDVVAVLSAKMTCHLHNSLTRKKIPPIEKKILAIQAHRLNMYAAQYLNEDNYLARKLPETLRLLESELALIKSRDTLNRKRHTHYDGHAS